VRATVWSILFTGSIMIDDDDDDDDGEDRTTRNSSKPHLWLQQHSV
jgi:hypothetical protein